MGITHLSGLEVAGVPTMGVGGLPPFTGNWYFVNETTGSDGNPGTADAPLATLAQAQTLATANQNDVVLFTGTIHQTSSLVWAKNQVHLIGLCAPLRRGKRARISVSGSTPFSYLVDVSASGCWFMNFGTFYGFSTVGSTTPICWRDTGGRNSYDNVEILGFGDGTVSTGTANQTTARSLLMSGSTGESTFRNCVFGVDTITRGAANYNIEIAGGAPRLSFENCDIEAYIGSGGTGGGWLLVGASGIDRYVSFAGTRFRNAVSSGASTLTQGFNVNAAAGGRITLDINSHWYGATHLETSASNCVYSAIPVFDTIDAGLTSEVVPS